MVSLKYVCVTKAVSILSNFYKFLFLRIAIGVYMVHVNPRLCVTMLHNALVLKSKMETIPSYLINLRTKLYIYITEKLQAQVLQYFLQY